MKLINFREIWTSSKEDEINRQKFLERELFKLDGKSAKRTSEFIMQLINKKDHNL